MATAEHLRKIRLRPDEELGEDLAGAIAGKHANPKQPEQTAFSSENAENNNLTDKSSILQIIDEIYVLVPQKIGKLGDIGEEELGKWINIASYVADNIANASTAAEILKLGDIAKRARVAIQCIITKPSGDHHCAMEMRHEILIDIYRVEDKHANWLIEKTNGSPAVTAVLGILTAATLFGIALTFSCLMLLALEYLLDVDVTGYMSKTFGNFAPLFPWAIIAAFIGGTASVLMRLDSFEARRGVDPKLLFLNAVFKPYIGMIISFFVVSVQGIGLISVPGLNSSTNIPDTSVVQTAGATTATFFLLAVGFLSGFSERFAKDFIGTTEDAFSRSRSDKHRSGGS